MALSDNEAAVLLGVLAETERVEELGRRLRPGLGDGLFADRVKYGRMRAEVNDLATLGVPLSTYLGGDAAGRKACGRALDRLQAAGLVVRSAAWGQRATHARLTEAGRAAAEQLRAERPEAVTP